MLASLRLTWRLQRWEIAFLIGASLVLAAVAAFAAWQLPVATRNLLDCAARFPNGPMPTECESPYDWLGYLSGAATIVQGATTVVPVIVGILLGAPLVSREIEKRTAPIAWSLARSRRWWLAGRMLPLALAIAIALLLLGQATEASILAVPDVHLNFRYFAMHGPLVAARGLAIFAIGAFVGLWIGRMLPAILVTGVLAFVMIAGLQVARAPIMRAEAVWTVPDEQGAGDFETIYGSGYIDDATGAFVSDQEAYERFPEEFETGSGELPGLTKVYLILPAERYPVFVAREMAAVVVIGLIAAAGALLLVRSRRPE